MSITAPQLELPHYLLLSETSTEHENRTCGCWRFVLEEVNGSNRVEVEEDEPGVKGERLQLLSVVRGLEALQEPSRVTLITPSKYVGRGIRQGLPMWRENNWSWEHFGLMTPIKNGDLWKRVDNALGFHKIECRVWSFDQLRSISKPSQQSNPMNRTPHRSSSLLVAKQKINGIAHLIADRFSAIGFKHAYGCA